MTNKKELIRKQTWEYFWQQKISEIIIFIIALGTIILVPFILGYYIGDNYDNSCQFDDKTPFRSSDSGGVEYRCNIIIIWLEGCGYILLFLLLVLILCLFFYILKDDILKPWIQSNWKKAEQRAKLKIEKGIKK